MKFSRTRLVQIIGVSAPALAIYASLAALGGIAPICAWYYHTILGNRPLPAITYAVLSMVSTLPISLHWIGLAVMLVLLSAAYVIARTAPSTESALKRLFLLASVEWVISFVFIAMMALALSVPVLPVFEAGENLDMEILPRFMEPVAKSGNPIIYEGLPRPESEQFESEKRTKPTIKMHGFYFYKEPIVLSQGDEETLQSLIVTTPPFIRWRGEKECMGYHPDFALQWRDAAGHSYDALICFGCGEAKLYGPGMQLYCDVPGPSYKTLKELLLKYRKNRP